MAKRPTILHEPAWFRDDQVLSINAPTCGINKDGHEQFVVDTITGTRSEQIDDTLWGAVDALAGGSNKLPTHAEYITAKSVDAAGIMVPCYYDHSSIWAFEKFIKAHKGLKSATLGELSDEHLVSLRPGHGSPSQDLRVGDVPYIKVSDLRAGHVNVNPTNLIPLALAHEYWGGPNSGLQPYDLISPERASKNIGEFCVLMPGQERIVLTREVIILRASTHAVFDQFYLMWAMSLREVREQWTRIVFMQTNREDVGDRVREIRIPVPTDKSMASSLSGAFRSYYTSLEKAREAMRNTLASAKTQHHFYI